MLNSFNRASVLAISLGALACAPEGAESADGASTGGSETMGSGGSKDGGIGSGGTSTGGAAGEEAPSGGAGGLVIDDGATGGSAPLLDRTIFVAGDSTVSTYADTASPGDQAGWGQMLPEIFSEQVTVDNRAVGGRTALWFSLEGRLDAIVAASSPGDYLFLQFGTNDSNKTATFTFEGTTYPRYAAAATDFKTHLTELYLDPARAAGMIPVLVTPPPRNSAYCGKGNSLGAYAAAMRELGAAEDVDVIDLNARTFGYLSTICPSPTPENFFFVRADASVDGTHFQENGARHMAGFIGAEIAALHLALEPYLKP